MTTIYKITLWAGKGHPTPLEIVLMGDDAATIATDVFDRLNRERNYSHGHLIHYDAESPNVVPDVADVTVLRSFDLDYLYYGSLGDDGDEDDYDDYDHLYVSDEYEPERDYPDDIARQVARNHYEEGEEEEPTEP